VLPARYRRHKRGLRILAWSVRVCGLILIMSIGALEYRIGDGLLDGLPLADFRANLNINRDSGSQFEVSMSTASRGGHGEDVRSDRGSAMVAVGGKTDFRGQSATKGNGPADVRMAAMDVNEGGVTCSMSRLESEGGGVTDNLLRVSFPLVAGRHVDGYGVSETSFPFHDRSPDYALPVLKWVQSQGALSGYGGIAAGVSARSSNLPNFLSPGSGGDAGDYMMGIAHGAVDFLAVGSGDFVSELNPWYHSLNSGFRTRILRELPCVRAEFDTAAAILNGGQEVANSARRREIASDSIYVADGKTRIYDYKVEGHRPQSDVGMEVKLAAPGLVSVAATLAAELAEQAGSPAAAGNGQKKSGWDIERARIGSTRSVNIELVSNGKVIASKPILADGARRDVSFRVPIAQSSWLALRIMGAAHTNPVFVLVNNAPVRGSKASVEWSMQSLLETYEARNASWSSYDAQHVRAAYEYAYTVYEKILAETTAQ
jgi:hypothetical protein